MGAKMFQIAELVWKKVRDYPQCLERRTIRSFLIQLFDKRRDLAKDAYQAGKLNSAYPVQLVCQFCSFNFYVDLLYLVPILKINISGLILI
jgi:hypothetical protein